MSTESKCQEGNNSNTVLAESILKAVLARDWETMLKHFPHGVMSKGDRYNSKDDFDEWEDYSEFARYVYPARYEMINLCITKAMSLL